MARPDCDDGWLKLAHELEAALSASDLNKRERILLSEVFSQMFGRSKASHAVLRTSAIAASVGHDKANMSRALAHLIDHGFLERVEDAPRGAVRFVKDYTRWTRPGPGGRGKVPRFTAREIVWIAQAPQRAMAVPDAPGGVVEIDNSGARVVDSDNSELSKLTTESCQNLQPTHCIEEVQEGSAAQPGDPRSCRFLQPHGRTPPPGDDFDRAVALILAASEREPQLEQTASVMASKRRSDLLGEIDALASAGWRWQFAARRFLSEREAALRAVRNTDRHWRWLRSVAQGATDEERAAEERPPAPRTPPVRKNPRDEDRHRIAEAFARKQAEIDARRRSQESGSTSQDARQAVQDAPGRDPEGRADADAAPAPRRVLGPRTLARDSGRDAHA